MNGRRWQNGARGARLHEQQDCPQLQRRDAGDRAGAPAATRGASLAPASATPARTRSARTWPRGRRARTRARGGTRASHGDEPAAPDEGIERGAQPLTEDRPARGEVVAQENLQGGGPATQASGCPPKVVTCASGGSRESVSITSRRPTKAPSGTRRARGARPSRHSAQAARLSCPGTVRAVFFAVGRKPGAPHLSASY